MGAFLASNGSANLSTSADLTFTTTRAIDVGEHVVVGIAASTTRVAVSTVTVGSLSLTQDISQTTNFLTAIWSKRATSLIPSGTTVTVHTSTTSAVFLGAVCGSLKGIMNPYLDKTASNSGASPGNGGTTAVTTQAQEIVIMVVGSGDSFTGYTNGFTSIGSSRVPSTSRVDLGYLDVGSLAAQSGTFTLSAGSYGAATATYFATSTGLQPNYQFVRAPDGISVSEKIR